MTNKKILEERIETILGHLDKLTKTLRDAATDIENLQGNLECLFDPPSVPVREELELEDESF